MHAADRLLAQSDALGRLIAAFKRELNEKFAALEREYAVLKCDISMLRTNGGGHKQGPYDSWTSKGTQQEVRPPSPPRRYDRFNQRARSTSRFEHNTFRGHHNNRPYQRRVSPPRPIQRTDQTKDRFPSWENNVQKNNYCKSKPVPRHSYTPPPKPAQKTKQNTENKILSIDSSLETIKAILNENIPSKTKKKIDLNTYNAKFTDEKKNSVSLQDNISNRSERVYETDKNLVGADKTENTPEPEPENTEKVSNNETKVEECKEAMEIEEGEIEENKVLEEENRRMEVLEEETPVSNQTEKLENEIEVKEEVQNDIPSEAPSENVVVRETETIVPLQNVKIGESMSADSTEITNNTFSVTVVRRKRRKIIKI